MEAGPDADTGEWPGAAACSGAGDLMARFNLKHNAADERLFEELAYGQGWTLALHTPGGARPSPLDDGWQANVRSVALVVWMVQPDIDAGMDYVDDREMAREAFEQAFMRGYGDCLQILSCWNCNAPNVEEVGRHFCSAGCRQAWRERHDSSEWAGILVCYHCKGPVNYPDQNFCGVLCEAEWTVACTAQ
jgi:hypothetical protein